ncbi:MAG: thioesterase family protein [Hyphomicrobiales bacterium]|nr:thioesterase family protein [Hyphomicrobiales bacterium]
MTERKDMPVVFFAPFVSSAMRVEPQWIDYNNHLNVAYYTLLFDRAVDECFALLGVGEDYVRRRKASMFTAEAHIGYRRELSVGEEVRMTLQLLDFDEKRLHYFMEMRHARDGWLAATSENMSLHVEMTQRRVAVFPQDVLATLALMKAAHSRLAFPDGAGRRIAMPQRQAERASERRH